MSISVETEWLCRRKGCQECGQGTSKRGRFESVIGKDTGDKGRGTIQVHMGVGLGGGGEVAGGRGTFLLCRSVSVFCRSSGN